MHDTHKSLTLNVSTEGHLNKCVLLPPISGRDSPKSTNSLSLLSAPCLKKWIVFGYFLSRFVSGMQQDTHLQSVYIFPPNPGTPPLLQGQWVA